MVEPFSRGTVEGFKVLARRLFTDLLQLYHVAFYWEYVFDYGFFSFVCVSEMALGNDPNADACSWRANSAGRGRILGTEAQASATFTGFHDRLASMFGTDWTVPGNTGARPRTTGTESANARPEMGSTAPGCSEPATDPVREELIRELRDQNRKMEERNRLMADQLALQQRQAQRIQEEQQGAFTRSLADVVDRIARDRRDRPQPQAQHQPPRDGGELARAALAQIPEYEGRLEEVAAEWIELLVKVGNSYGWAQEQWRQAAVSKLRLSARDWQMVEGIHQPRWAEWSASFLAAFGRVLTIDQWVAQVQGRVRQVDESVRAYCYSKVRICRRCPVPINDREIIRYLTLVINKGKSNRWFWQRNLGLLTSSLRLSENGKSLIWIRVERSDIRLDRLLLTFRNQRRQENSARVRRSSSRLPHC